MGNQHSAAHIAKPRKNVHWKSAGRPAPPGKPDIIPILTDDEPNAITLRWAPAAHDGGAPLQGYQVECNRLGSPDWIRTAPPIVLRPELVLTGLEPPHRYQFRVAALNAVGRSEYSELSDVLTVSFERGAQEAPVFLQHLDDITALENDKTEFRVSFTGAPTPTIAWFKDDYEIFSSRRTAITTDESSSVLVFHQTLASDEGEIKCTATNRAGHAVTKARLALEAAPKLRYPRQYEDGLLYEINETVFLKTTIVGKPTPIVEWRHDGQPIIVDDRVEITNTPKYSVLKIHSARRSDRGEYQVHAKNNIGEDTAAFLVTITAPPDPPKRVSVTRQVDKSVTLDWEPPEDDGGCRIGNYVVEYYRTGWNVWLKATTSRKTNVTLFDLIEGSEYRFRVKAESPYGMSAPSVESAAVKIPGRAVDVEFLAIESRIINEVLTKEEGEVPRVSPVPRRKRANTAPEAAPPSRMPRTDSKDPAGSNEFMLVLYPDKDDKAEKRKSFQLDLEDALSPPPISLSAPELSSRCIMPFKALRNAVSSTELLHERAMARFYKAVQMKEEQTKQKDDKPSKIDINTDIPYTSHAKTYDVPETKKLIAIQSIPKTPEIFIKTDSIEDRHYKYNSRQASHDSETSENRWQQNMSFDEDYTASTVSTDGEYSDEEGSYNGELDRRSQYSNEEDTYNPRNKMARHSPSCVAEEVEEEESEKEILKPLPLPDPNFVPKPILKRRELDLPPQTKQMQPKIDKGMSNSIDEKFKPVLKPKKDEKMSMFKKFTKMPVQKPFQFPKILSKKEPEKQKEEESLPNNTNKMPNKTENIRDKVSDEGRTVIDYYTNIVKEYGSQKKPTTTLYTTTEDLKTVAEIQEKTEVGTKDPMPGGKKVVKQKKANSKKITKSKQLNSIDKTNSKQISGSERPKVVKKLNSTPHAQEKPVSLQDRNKKCTQQIVLKKTERATIVIPIDYQELEQKAKVTVRSAIDYTVDMCLLLLAFWVYFFKDERLAIPFLILIIYRQLQETFLMNIPDWVRRHTPSWIKKKIS
ncbi:uncharacterized protein LOC106134039 [Amyelois transitella]|uniref:uncharacterized protein LOC106134039 n=1 Tax=Amyelois transitella TaxID=680683 RepID=UPI00067DFF40|nr:uncharacterized protein LOC106134039 [Amyelois transitella]